MKTPDPAIPDRLVDVSFSEGGLDPDEIVKMNGWEGIDDATSKEIAIVYVYESLEDKARFIREHPDLEISKNGNEGTRNPDQGGLLDSFVSDPTQAKWYRDALEAKERGPALELETWRLLGLPAFEPTGERIYLRVKFETETDRDAYAEKDGLKIAKKTRGVLSCWWPPRPREDLSSLRFDIEAERTKLRAKYSDVEVPVGQDPLFGDRPTIRKRRWHEDVLIGSRTRQTEDGEIEAYCWYGDHWLPAERRFWFRDTRTHSLHLGARCKECHKIYRSGAGVAGLSPAAMPRYPVYIPSKGRYQEDRALTIKVLLRDKVPFYVVVEPQEEAQYVACAGREHVLVLPFSNLGLGSIPARNWLKDHAAASGAARHWCLDDNVIEFRRLWKGRRIPCHAGVALRVVEDLTDAHDNVAISGLNYQMFVPAETPIPFYRNVHVYSAILLDGAATGRDGELLRWRGRFNEDTDLCLQALDAGHCTILVNAFMANKLTTMAMGGGNSDELYKDDGRLKMARSLEAAWPGIVTTRWKFGRPQHSVRWDKFTTSLRLLEVDLRDGDEYGLRLRAVGDIASPSLRRLLEES
jgi:hypothetical protein